MCQQNTQESSGERTSHQQAAWMLQSPLERERKFYHHLSVMSPYPLGHKQRHRECFRANGRQVLVEVVLQTGSDDERREHGDQQQQNVQPVSSVPARSGYKDLRIRRNFE